MLETCKALFYSYVVLRLQYPLYQGEGKMEAADFTHGWQPAAVYTKNKSNGSHLLSGKWTK